MSKIRYKLNDSSQDETIHLNLVLCKLLSMEALDFREHELSSSRIQIMIPSQLSIYPSSVAEPSDRGLGNKIPWSLTVSLVTIISWVSIIKSCK